MQSIVENAQIDVAKINQTTVKSLESIKISLYVHEVHMIVCGIGAALW